MRIRFVSLILIFSFMCQISVWSDQKPRTINIGLVHHKMGFPFLSDPIGDTSGPGISSSLEYPAKQGDSFSNNYGLTASVINPPGNTSYGIRISIGFCYIPRWESSGDFYIDGIAGFFCSLVFSKIPVYKATENDISQVRDWGRPYIGFKLGLRPGWNLENRTDIPIRLYTQADMEFLYAPAAGFGILNAVPATNLGVGIQYRFEEKSNVL